MENTHCLSCALKNKQGMMEKRSETVFKYVRHSLYGEYGMVHGGWEKEQSHAVSLNARTERFQAT
jgi:hypothetical protein